MKASIASTTIHKSETSQSVGFPCQAALCEREAMAIVDLRVLDTTWQIWACMDHAEDLETQLLSDGMVA